MQKIWNRFQVCLCGPEEFVWWKNGDQKSYVTMFNQLELHRILYMVFKLEKFG
jgi:hypothetical protein